MRVLVCGGRDYGKNPDGSDNEAEIYFLCNTLEDIRMKHPGMIVIQGEARGADKTARRWAEIVKVPVVSFPANWALYGNLAGPIRNLQMIQEGRPDLVVAFKGGAGTRNMIKQATLYEIEVITPCMK
jgi:hypothetical protein